MLAKLFLKLTISVDELYQKAAWTMREEVWWLRRTFNGAAETSFVNFSLSVLENVRHIRIRVPQCHWHPEQIISVQPGYPRIISSHEGLDLSTA